MGHRNKKVRAVLESDTVNLQRWDSHLSLVGIKGQLVPAAVEFRGTVDDCGHGSGRRCPLQFSDELVEVVDVQLPLAHLYPEHLATTHRVPLYTGSGGARPSRQAGHCRCKAGQWSVSAALDDHSKKGKGCPHSIAECRVPELIPVLGSQPAGDMSHKPGGRLPLLSTRHVVTLATLKRAATNFAAWWTEARRVWTICLSLLPDSIAAAI